MARFPAEALPIVFRRLDDVPSDFGPSAVAIGKFDGVHAGHRRVIGSLRERAAAEGLVPMIVTFDRNPLAVLAPERCPRPLTSNAQRDELIGDAGVEVVLELPFDDHLRASSPESFVDDILVGTLRVKLVFVGSDFRFGLNGRGDVRMLERLGERDGFEVVVVDDVLTPVGSRTSSTMIRTLLDEGGVREATEALGRLPAVRSIVVHGEARGRELGYPTANLDPAMEGYLPVDGVYAAWATVDGERYGAAVSIGDNPTFDGVPARQLEAHLFDQQLDLYGKTMLIEFVEYLRPMNAFTTVEALVEQLHRDDDTIRGILAAES